MAAASNSDDKLKLFISYSRRDTTIADTLVGDLERANFEVTIDRRDLPYGEAWQKELEDFIRASDTVVWLVSPESVRSKWCSWELGEVGRLNKRLVPVRIHELPPESIPESLGRIHLLPAEGVYDRAIHFSHLRAALDTDRTWVKEATRLADRAREWITKGRDTALLLRGPALRNAESWATRRPKAAPTPAGDVLELLLASRRGAVKRQRWAVGGALTVASIATILAGAAWSQWQRAERELKTATAQRLAAEARGAIVASMQDDRPGAPDAQRGVLLALESLRVQSSLHGDSVPKEGLRKLPGTSLELKLGENDLLKGLGPRADWIAIERGDEVLIFDSSKRIYRPPNEHEATVIKSTANSPVPSQQADAGSLAKSPDGTVLLAQSDKVPREGSGAILELIRASDKKVLATLPHEWQVQSSLFRNDGRHAMTVTGRVSMDAEDPSATRLPGSTVYVWDAQSGEKLAEMSFAHWGGIVRLVIDETGDWIALQTSDASRTSLIVMPIWPDVARHEACRRLTRNLSPSEWSTFVATEPRRETCPGLPVASE